MLVAIGMLVLGIVLLFFEQTKSIAPLLIGFGVGMLGAVAGKKEKQ